MEVDENNKKNAEDQKSNRDKKAEANKSLQRKANQLDKPRSSLTLQIMLFFDWYFTIFYFVVTIILLIYKAYELPYPSPVWELEFIMLLLFFGWQLIKIDLGNRGNKTEHSMITLGFVILAILSVLPFVFYIRLQTYVLVIEVILNAIGLFF